MTNFMLGLGLAVLGFGFYQLSKLFNLYDADGGSGFPIVFWMMRIVSYLLMLWGGIVLILSFVKGG